MVNLSKIHSQRFDPTSCCGDSSCISYAKENILGTFNNSNNRKCSTDGCPNPAFGENSQCLQCQWTS